MNKQKQMNNVYEQNPPPQKRRDKIESIGNKK